MKLPRLCLLIFAAASLSMGMANTASAGTMKYPTKIPAFVFDVPDEWTTKLVGGGSDALYCKANDGSKLNVQFFSIDNAELHGDNEGFAKAALAAGKVTDIKVVKSGDEEVGDKLTVKFVRSTFTQGDASEVSLMVFLPIGNDKSCIIHCFLPKGQLDDHKDEIQTLLNSIRMLK